MKSSVSRTDGLAAGLALRLEPEQDEREHRRDHVEAAVDRVGHPPSRYQAGSRAGGDRGAVERRQRRALPGRRRTGAGERTRSAPRIVARLAPVSHVHIGRASQARQAAPGGRAPAFRRFQPMTFAHGSRASCAIAVGGRARRRLHRDPRPSGLSRRRDAGRRDPARRRQSRFGRRHARPADLRRPVRPARLVLCLAQHPQARLRHAAARPSRPCSTSASTQAGNVGSVERNGHGAGRHRSIRASDKTPTLGRDRSLSRSCSAISARSASAGQQRARPPTIRAT